MGVQIPHKKEDGTFEGGGGRDKTSMRPFAKLVWAICLAVTVHSLYVRLLTLNN